MKRGGECEKRRRSVWRGEKECVKRGGGECEERRRGV